jgi:hypothetical protein
MLENMWNEIEYHLKIVWVTDGTHTGMHWKFLSCSLKCREPYFLCFRNVCNVVKILRSICVLFNLFCKFLMFIINVRLL